VNVVVSPYHLTTREAPAMAALALARRVITVLPVGERPVEPRASGRDDRASRAMVARVPAFGEFMRTWAWTVPLWNEGLLSDEHMGDSAVDDVWRVARYIEEESQCLPLRHFLRFGSFEDERAYLHALATDLLKGGPDPGISLPVAAGLDRFATRRGLIVARTEATSVAQRAEAGLGTPLVQLVVPVFTQATARRVLHYREVLEDQIARLGSACERAAQSQHQAALRDVSDAAEALTHAYEAAREELLMGTDDDEVRAIEGAVSISIVRLPWDAVLTSSVRAIHHMAGTSAGVHAPERSDQPAPEPAMLPTMLPTLHDGVRGCSFASIVVRAIGQTRRRA
jgi:hypothetical protein